MGHKSKNPERKRQDNENLLSAFNSKFRMNVSDVEVVKRLLGTPAVLGWYKVYRSEVAAENSARNLAEQRAMSQECKRKREESRAALAEQAIEIKNEADQKIR